MKSSSYKLQTNEKQTKRQLCMLPSLKADFSAIGFRHVYLRLLL